MRKFKSIIHYKHNSWPINLFGILTSIFSLFLVGCSTNTLIEVDANKSSDSILSETKITVNNSVYSHVFLKKESGLELCIQKNQNTLPISLLLLDSVEQIRVISKIGDQGFKYYFNSLGISGLEVNYRNDEGVDILHQGKILMNNRATNLNSGNLFSLFYDTDSIIQSENSKVSLVTSKKEGEVLTFSLIAESPLGYEEILIQDYAISSELSQVEFNCSKLKGMLKITGILKRERIKGPGEKTINYDRIPFFLHVRTKD